MVERVDTSLIGPFIHSSSKLLVGQCCVAGTELGVRKCSSVKQSPCLQGFTV